MITLNKWYPLVQPTYDAKTISFDRAVEKKQEEFRLAVECKKLVIKTLELEVELYNKRARQNTISLENISNCRHFAIFV